MMDVKRTENSGPRQLQKFDYPWIEHYPEAVKWDMPLTPRPLNSLLDQSIEKFGNRPAITFFGKTMTYRELGRAVERTAAALQAMGVKKGTKVGLFLPNCPTFVVFYYATAKAGGTVVNYNPLYTIDELTYQIKDSDTEIMITLDLAQLFPKIETLLDQGVLSQAIVLNFHKLLPPVKSVLFRVVKAKDRAKPGQSNVRGRIVTEAELAAKAGPFMPVDIDPIQDIAVLQYTGGTTGTPKGAMLTHANVVINAHQAAAWATELEPGRERMFGGLPFFHVFAMTAVMNFAIATGAEMVIMPRFILNDALQLIHKTRPTVMPGVPTMYRAMLNHPKLKEYNLSTLKFCLSGGAALPLELKREFEAMTGCKMVEGYGLSETAPIATINPLYGGAKEGSIGQPLPHTVLSIRDLEDPRKEVKQGDCGEICISGPQVMAGYWKKPQATADVFIGNFLRTGDVGYMDEQGFTFITDRIKDMIIRGGKNIYPRQIEEVVMQHPAAEEVIVIGIKDDFWGEVPKAFIKLRSGKSASEKEMHDFLATKISKDHLPAEIEFREQLPKTMIGKLSKKELKAEEEAKRAAKKA